MKGATLGTAAGPVVAGIPQTAPDDRHNQELVANVRPEGWANPEPAPRYDLVVVGAGTAGLVTAAGAAGLGARVALVERELLGGDCLNVGCVPSKALLRCARAAADARRAPAFGVRIGGEVSVDFSAVMERMRRLRARLSPNDSARRFRDELGVDVFIGDGAFTGPDVLEVDGRTLRFKRACVATGSRAAVPPIEGLAEAGFLTNRTVFSLTELPPRLAVLGAGPIGCELAQAFARFGAEVSLVEMGSRVLPRESRAAAERIERALREDGVRLHLASRLARVRPRGGRKTLDLDAPEGDRDLTVDEVVVAVGRRPNVDGLGLEEAGVAYDSGRGIAVDARLRTSNRRIYAAGDVCLDHKFTHIADAAARVVIRNALFWGRAKLDRAAVPWCTYTDPEVAHVGLYPREAEEQGYAVQTTRVDLSEVDRAVLEGDDDGCFLAVYRQAGKGRILGATLVAAHAGEVISELTTAMRAGADLGDLAQVIHPYPTRAEAIRRAADAYNRTRLTPFVRKILGLLLRLLR